MQFEFSGGIVISSDHETSLLLLENTMIPPYYLHFHKHKQEELATGSFYSTVISRRGRSWTSFEIHGDTYWYYRVLTHRTRSHGLLFVVVSGLLWFSFLSSILLVIHWVFTIVGTPIFLVSRKKISWSWKLGAINSLSPPSWKGGYSFGTLRLHCFFPRPKREHTQPWPVTTHALVRMNACAYVQTHKTVNGMFNSNC